MIDGSCANCGITLRIRARMDLRAGAIPRWSLLMRMRFVPTNRATVASGALSRAPHRLRSLPPKYRSDLGLPETNIAVLGRDLGARELSYNEMAPVPSALDRSTVRRVSIITALGFAVAALSATYLDGVLSTHVVYHRVRKYPLGFWILPATPAFFVIPYVALSRWVHAPIRASWLPAALCAVRFLWNLRPDLLHAGFALDIGSYEVLALVTVVIRQAADLPSSVTESRSSDAVRVWCLEEAIKDWRAALVLATTTSRLPIFHRSCP